MEKSNIINTKMITLIYFVFVLYTLTAYMSPEISFLGATLRIFIMDVSATYLFIFVHNVLTTGASVDEITEQIKSGIRKVKEDLKEVSTEKPKGDES